MEKEWNDDPVRTDVLTDVLAVFSSLADMIGDAHRGDVYRGEASAGKRTNPTSSVDFASSAIGKSSSAQINTMLSGMQERGGVYSINLVVDGRTLANVMFDPLSGVAKQKGVALGA